MILKSRISFFHFFCSNILNMKYSTCICFKQILLFKDPVQCYGSYFTSFKRSFQNISVDNSFSLYTL